MLLRLLLLFAIVPVIEVWLIIKVGRVIGPLPTIAILLAVSLAGALLARAQGFRVIAAIRDELAAGRLPAAHILDGAFVLAGGILLLTPGFFTDLVGLAFLFPPSRRLLKFRLGIWLENRLRRGSLVVRRF